jgi:6-phosphogluconolactonase (cycloisomerase 2 family)
VISAGCTAASRASVRVALAALFACLPLPGAAQVVAIALDPKAELVDGELRVKTGAQPGALAVLRFDGAQAERIGLVALPTGFQGPPASVAITPDGRFALVTASLRIDPADGELKPESLLSVVDLSASPMKVVQTLRLDATPAMIALHPDGRTALVPQPADDSLGVLSFADGRAKVVGKLQMDKDSKPQAIAFAPDGRHALVSFSGADKLALYTVRDGNLVQPAAREMVAGVYPTPLAWCGASGLAVVGNYGRVSGDVDTVSLIDASGPQARVVDTVSVGPSPEGIACSADGRHVAVAAQNMSTVSAATPFHVGHSLLVLLRIDGKRLRRVDERPFGAWAQGVGFLGDSRTVFAQSMGERALHLFRIEGDTLRVAGPPIVFEKGGPAGYGVGPSAQ